MMFIQCVRAIFLTLLIVLPSQADELTDAAQNLCEKIKSCAVAQMSEEELTPDVRQMMQPMLDGMCENMQTKIKTVPADHPLYKPATACMRSMETLSCEVMQDPDKMRTPECEAYEKLVMESGEGP